MSSIRVSTLSSALNELDSFLLRTDAHLQFSPSLTKIRLAAHELIEDVGLDLVGQKNRGELRSYPQERDPVVLDQLRAGAVLQSIAYVYSRVRSELMNPLDRIYVSVN